MLATFGLERLESGLDRDTVSATDVAEFLEQARADDVRTLARDGMPKALDGMHRRLQRTRFPSSRLPGPKSSRTNGRICQHRFMRTTAPILNFSRLGMPIVCSVATHEMASL